MHEKQVLIVLLWSGLIFIGYHVLTAEAATTDTQQDRQKELCVDDYKAKWKDGECKFTKERIEEFDDQGDYEDDLFDMGLYDDYYNRNTDKEEREKIEKQNQKSLEEPQQIEDWKNEVDTPDNIELNSPVVTKYDNEEDREEQEKEIKEFNEAQDEDTESEDNSSGGEEDDESEEQDEPEEEEQDEPEEEEEESESEE